MQDDPNTESTANEDASAETSSAPTEAVNTAAEALKILVEEDGMDEAVASRKIDEVTDQVVDNMLPTTEQIVAAVRAHTNT